MYGHILGEVEKEGQTKVHMSNTFNSLIYEDTKEDPSNKNQEEDNS